MISNSNDIKRERTVAFASFDEFKDSIARISGEAVQRRSELRRLIDDRVILDSISSSTTRGWIWRHTKWSTVSPFSSGRSSTPIADRKVSTNDTCPSFTASKSGALCARSMTLKSPPASVRIFTGSLCPDAAASCSAVEPSV